MNTYLLTEVKRAKREEREEFRAKQMEKVLTALDKLAGKVDFKKAYIFGSLTKPYAFYPDSDIDLGFTSLKDRDFFKAISFLSSELGRDVDVIQMEKHKLRNKITQEGIKWKRQN